MAKDGPFGTDTIRQRGVLLGVTDAGDFAGPWIAFVVTTLAAYITVLFTGRYPPAIFAFNVGVLRRS